MPDIPGYLVEVLISLALAAGTGALGLLAAYLQKARANVKSKLLGNILDVVGSVAFTAVSQTMETSVRVIKAASADGKLTAAEASAAFQTALNTAWNSLTADMKRILTKEAGGVQAAKDKFIAPSISQSVLDAKTVFAQTLNKPRSVEATSAQLARARQFLR